MAKKKQADPEQTEFSGVESDKNDVIERIGRKLRNAELDVKKQNRDIKNWKKKVREAMHAAGIKPVAVGDKEVFLYQRRNIVVSVDVNETVKVLLGDEVRGRRAKAPTEGESTDNDGSSEEPEAEE